MAADCSGRGNEERISRTAKMLLGMWQTAIHRSPRSARGGDGAHDANMNKDWSKEVIRHHFDKWKQHLQQIFKNTEVMKVVEHTV